MFTFALISSAYAEETNLITILLPANGARYSIVGKRRGM